MTLKSSGPLVITTPGAVIQGLDISGGVVIKAPNVTLLNCKVSSSGYNVVQIDKGVTGVVVQNCTIDAQGAGGMGIAGQGKFIGNNIYGAADGIDVRGDNTVIQDNYIHGMAGSSASHFDGIQADGGFKNLTIDHNTVINENNQTSAIMLDNYWGSIDNVKINNNLLVGGGYTVYMAEMGSGQPGGGPVTNVSFTNNHVGPGYYGDLYLRSELGHTQTISGNVNDGATIAKALATTGQNTSGSTPSTPTSPTTPTQPTTPDAPKIDAFSNDSGVAGDHITNDNTVTLTGKAAANSTVKVFDGTTQIGTATANGSGAWSYTTAALKDGSHSLTAKATNASGATSAASAALSLKIDTTAPTAPTMATSAASTAATTAATAGTAANTVTVTGTAEANSTVKVFDGSTQIGTATANNSGAWTFTSGALASGNHSLTSKATDAAGNTGAASKAVTVNIPSTPTTPTTPTDPTGNPGTPSTPGAPKIASFSNDTGVRGDGITSDNTLTLTGTAAANSVVKVFDGAKQIGTATANSSGAWNYTTTALADGAHNLTAKVTDKAGTSASSADLSVKIDTHAPDAPKIASFSSDGKAVSGGAVHTDHVTLTGTAEANSVVKVFDGTKQIGTATTNDKGAWTYAADNLADGKHSFTSTASDAAGNISKASAAVGLNVDTHNDAHTADSAFTGLYQKWNDTVTFKGTADPYSQVTIYDNGKGSVGTVKAASDGTWSLSTKSAVSDTVHNFTTKVVDSSGHSSMAAGSAILGTNGGDMLKGTSGNDLFSGNGGRDTFVFAPNFGKDVIKDFQEAGRSHDVVQFSKSVFDSFADVLAHASQSGQDVVINAGSGHSLTLKDTKLASLDKYDFHFA